MVVKKNIAMVLFNDDVYADDVDNPLIMTMLLRSITSALLSDPSPIIGYACH